MTYKARQWLDLGLISLQYRQLYFFFGHKSLFENRKKWNINWGTFVLEPGYREEERTSTGRFVGKVNLNWKYIFPTNLNCSQCISCSPGSDTIIWEAFFATFYKEQSSSNIPVWFSVFLDSFQSRTNFQFAEIKESLEVESTERGTKSFSLSVFGFSNKERDCSVISEQWTVFTYAMLLWSTKGAHYTPPLSVIESPHLYALPLPSKHHLLTTNRSPFRSVLTLSAKW